MFELVRRLLFATRRRVARELPLARVPTNARQERTALMKQVRSTLIACCAVLAVGCVAHIDSSAQPIEDDGGVAGSAASKGAAGKAAKPAPKHAEREDDAGTTLTKPDASKPVVSDDDDDAGRPAVAMPPAASTPKPDAAAACDFRGLVMMKCGGSGCHGGPTAGTGLDLTTAMLATRVEGRKGPAACASNLLIDKANPTKSALYLKVSGSTCGSQMPLTGGTLTASEQACVLSWIEGLP
jgi:hypothetical protein